MATQTGNGFSSPKPQYVYVFAVFAVNALGSRAPRPARPSLSWPSHRSTTWPVTLACALALPETVSDRVFGRIMISRAGFLCYETQHFTSP